MPEKRRTEPSADAAVVEIEPTEPVKIAETNRLYRLTPIRNHLATPIGRLRWSPQIAKLTRVSWQQLMIHLPEIGLTKMNSAAIFSKQMKPMRWAM